ncbi:ATP-binding protein [Sphaerisporangium album]|uniref:ATP-binding protein n=1 Tax=Sphaerisporangium album TaxID=509200 RepID=A0A367FM94_9ACTN|nr:ATP-binding protein [Sphaerisporangium album]RCG31508.1 ATP-binding protein [Sphaerisporangium album]
MTMTLTESAPAVDTSRGFGPVLHIRPARHPGRQATWVLLPEPATVPRTRRRVRRQLAAWGIGEQSDVAELLVSEVVTNAMRHAWAAVMTVSMDDGMLRCEVQDTNPALPRVCEAHDGDEGGRGMYLMEALSGSWGSYRVSSGKVVWFELPAAEQCPARAAEDDERTA